MANVTNEELAIRIKAGIDVPENMLQLWEQTKDFIHVLALRYQGLADLEDMEQEGYLALYDAVDGFRPEKDCKFLTYAKHWIHQHMRRYIDNCCRTVRIPVHEQEKINQYRKMANVFQVYRGRKPTKWEIAYNLNLNESQIQGLEAAIGMSQVGSLDSTLQEGEDGALWGTMACDTDLEGEVIDRIDQDILQTLIWPMVDRLPDRQRDVIRKRYQENRTLKEIGEIYGVTINAVWQLECDGLRRLRRSSDTRKLLAFLPEWLEAEAYRHNGIREFNHTWESSTERVALKLL